MVVSEFGKKRRLTHPGVDPFWETFEKYLSKRHG
jgi:hypothetical protein